MAQTSLIYTAALSKDYTLRGDILKFSDGIMAAVSLPITAKLMEKWKRFH